MEFYPWLKNQREAPPDTPQLTGVETGIVLTGNTTLLTPTLAAANNVGAQVGVRRNLEFSAGERAHRISTGSYTKA